MVESRDDHASVKCIFCGKELERSEMVRYRGAIACRECASEQESKPNPILRPFFYLADIGCLIGIFTFIYFSFHVQLYSLVYPESYIQPLLPFLSGMSITILFVSLGLYAINRIHLFTASIVSVIIGIIAAASSVLALYDFVTYGPYYIVENVTITKTINYYPTVLATYSLFAITAALAILLHMANTRTEYSSVASAALFLLSSAIVMPILSWIVVGTLNALAFSVAFVFFVSRRRIYDEAPIQPV